MAGPIHRVDEATATTWRNNLKESSYSDIEFIDPLDVHDSTEDVQIVRDGFEASAERLYDDDATIVTDSEVVTTDLSLIDECDALIAYWPKGVDFTGTKMEVFYAAHNGLTTAAVFDHIHEIGPWFHHHIDYVDFDFDGAVAYLRQRT
jgi:nucleoside 2-deoxyribosyltransferase